MKFLNPNNLFRALACCASIACCDAEVHAGDSFPSPAANGVAGKLPKTEGKVVLYDFWASWCAPCRAAMPAYEGLYQKYHQQGFEIIAVGTDEDAGAAQTFVAGLKLSFPVVVDVKQKFVALVEPSTMPTAYLVGKNNKVISVHSGFHGAKTIEALSQAIETAMK